MSKQPAKDAAHWLIRTDYYGHPMVTGVFPETATEVQIAKATSRDHAQLICTALNLMKDRNDQPKH